MRTLLDEIIEEAEPAFETLEIPGAGTANGGTDRRGYTRPASNPATRESAPPRDVLSEFEDQGLNDLEIVPPTDSRVRITDTKRIPYQWICSVIPTFQHPTTGDPIEMTTQPGSGVLIGPRHILTAAHVLFPTSGPLIHQAPLRVKVTPGHNDRSEPYGHYVSTVYKVRSEWRSGGRNTENPSWDFAVIEVPNTIQQRGLKCWGASGTNTHKYPIDKAWLKGKRVNVCGYPRDKTLYTQWIAHDLLDDPQPKRNGNFVANLFTYKADTCLGQSGAPVWYWDGKSHRYLVGIHRSYCDFLDGCSQQSGTGCMPGSSRWSHNVGVLFTKEVETQINTWLT